VPISHSQDTAGPMTRSVADAAFLLGALAGPDPQDGATAKAPRINYASFLRKDGLRGKRLGVARNFFGAHAGVDALVEKELALLEAQGPVAAETAAALATGCRRVNLGTAALESPEWCARAIAEHGDRIAIGLDVRGTRLAARGWTQEGGELDEVLDQLEAAGCARYVVTDVTKDGTLRGPNLDLLREVCARTDAPVIASGGISTLADLAALRELVPTGVEGAIVGTALYSGAFTITEALDVAGRPGA